MIDMSQFPIRARLAAVGVLAGLGMLLIGGSGLLAQSDVWEPGPKSAPVKNDPPEEG